MLTRKTDTAVPKRAQRLKQLDFHELCIKSAITISITVGTVRFIWHEVEWIVKAVGRGWVSLLSVQSD